MPAPAPTPPPARPFPWWVPLGGLVLALLYLPTLATPFDFIDDGNLVYPAPAGTTVEGHLDRYADKVAANVTHLGPFRPVVWAHWEVSANLAGGDPAVWRLSRLVWCGLAATMLLAFLRGLNVPAPAALVAGLAAMANPYRNEIWTSLTLAEGVAMPYCLLALTAARKASGSPRPGKWDALAIVSLLAALGCKNTFAALVPAMLALRLLPDGVRLTAAVRANAGRVPVYLAPLLLPAAHFVYFKLNWHPGQYETPGPSLGQLGKMLGWLKGAAGADFLGVGVGLMLVVVWRARRSARQTQVETRPPTRPGHYRALMVAAGLLLAAGVAVYLPLPMMAARYTMPAVWGVDLALALLVTATLAAPAGWPKRLAVAGVAAGLVGLVAASYGRQEKFAARARLLWDALHHVEATAPPGTRVAWVGGETSAGALNVEEGIHFQWHLFHRGRGDIRVGLVDAAGAPVPRVELPPLAGPPDYRLAMGQSPAASGVEFAAAYRLGRKRLTCRLDPIRGPAAVPTMPDAELLTRLAEAKQAGGPATAELRP